MSRSIRRAMIDRDHQQLSLVRQCILLDVSRASVYYRSVPTRAEDLELMALMDRQYLKTPFYGSRKMKAWLLQQGYLVSRKRVRRLMRLMGLEAIYRRPNTSKPAPGHRIFPYLLKGVEVNRVDQVWAADITYIPMAKGFLYLVAIMDWHSRHVLAWKLSNTMDTSFCVAALEEALGKGRPEIFNTDQGTRPSPRPELGSMPTWSSTTGRGLTRLWATGPQQRCTNMARKKGEQLKKQGCHRAW